MSNTNNTKVTTQEIFNTAKSWITSTAQNCNGSWNANNFCPERRTFGNSSIYPCGNHYNDYLRETYIRGTNTVLNYVNPDTVTSQLQTYLASRGFNTSDTTTTLTIDRLSYLLNCIISFISSKLKFVVFDNALVNHGSDLTSRILYDQNENNISEPSQYVGGNDINRIYARDFNTFYQSIQNALVNLVRTQKVSYSISLTSTSCCSSSSCSSSCSGFIAHIK